MSLYLGTTPIAVNSSSREIGEIIQSTIPLSDAGLHLLDGALISGAGSYSAFVTYIAGLVSNYPDLFITETNWQQAVTDYGVCGKFVYDSTNNTVRLPKYSNKIYTGGGTAPVVGNGRALGIDTAYGTGFAGYYQESGDYHVQLMKSNIISGSDNNQGISFGSGTGARSTWGITTDATKSGIIADLSNITTALDGYYYIVIANSVKTDIEVNIDEVMTDLNGKADVDLSNVNTSGTSLASGWAMPSDRYIDLTLGASGSTYTAPANGYIYFSKDRSGSSNQYAVISGASDGIPGSLGDGAQADGYGVHILRPIKKGTTFRVTYTLTGTTKYFRFVYAEGEPNV